jgi:uncharacterized damage-inducible protein DinB
MNYTETLARQITMGAMNMAYNLDFIAADKLDWKPAPEAKSALEIINHMIEVLHAITARLSGSSEQVSSTPVTNAAEAKQSLISATQQYVDVLRTIKPEDMNRMIDMRFGPLPVSVIVTMPVFDLIHHHGQIAYIQSLLGDTESHFHPEMLKP